MVNNWIWVTQKEIQINPKAHDFKGKGTVGVILSTNTESQFLPTWKDYPADFIDIIGGSAWESKTTVGL